MGIFYFSYPFFLIPYPFFNSHFLSKFALLKLNTTIYGNE